MKTKKCPRCEKPKSLDEFYTSKRSKSGRECYCIECNKEKSRDDPNTKKRMARYYRQHKTKLAGAQMAKRRTQRLPLDRLKEENGCVVCGITDRRVLDFHHTNPDEKKISIGETATLHKYSQEQLLAEASKCIVICANHHRILHAEDNEKKYGKTY